MKKRVMAAVALFVFLFSTFAFAPTGFAIDYAIIAIKQSDNPTLYNVMKAKYGFDPHGYGYISNTELATITGLLDLSNKGIAKADGLKYCSNVINIRLSDNANIDISDFGTELVTMNKLEGLSLGNCKLTAIPADMGMPNLVMLDISNNANFSYLSRVTQFANLDTLRAESCNISDFSAWKNMASLKALQLRYNPIATIPDLSQMTGLVSIDFDYDTSLGTFSKNTLTNLTTAPNLGELILANTNIRDYSFLQNATKLYYLYIASNGLTPSDMDSLDCVTDQLTWLNLNNNPLDNGCIQKIRAFFPNLTELNMDSDGLSDIGGLAGLGLTDLSIAYNHISDITVLSGMPELRNIDIHNNCIHDISVLKQLPKLISARVSDNYLDLSSGSDDIAVINSLPSCTFYLNPQNQCTLSYICDAAHGALSSSATDKLYYEQSFYPPNVTVNDPANEAFYGWDANGDGTADSYGDQVKFVTPEIPMPGDQATYTAVFGPASNTVTFDAQGGSAVASITAAFNTAISPPATARGGYTLGGWYRDAACTQAWNFDTDTVRGPLTLFAKWVSNIKITCSRTDVKEYGASTGSITITATGGESGSYNYSIDGGATWQDSAAFGSLAAGSYKAMARDAANPGYVSEATAVTVIQPKLSGSCYANRLPSKVYSGTALAVKPAAPPKGYTLKSVTYASGNQSIASINAKGIVSFLKGGKVKLTVTAVYQMKKNGKMVSKTVKTVKQITVVQKVTSVKLNNTSATLALKRTLALKAAVGPSSAGNKRVKWTSSNPKVATVSSKGVVTARSAGTAVITCTAQDGSKVHASCKITVEKTSVKLDKTSAALAAKKTLALKVSFTPSSALKTVKWKSSNTKVATVSSKGVVTARKKGTAVITCTAQDGSKAAAKCTVTVS